MIQEKENKRARSWYECEECGKMFTSEMKLHNHERYCLKAQEYEGQNNYEQWNKKDIWYSTYMFE